MHWWRHMQHLPHCKMLAWANARGDVSLICAAACHVLVHAVKGMGKRDSSNGRPVATDEQCPRKNLLCPSKP